MTELFMTELIISIVFGFVTLILCTIASKLVHNERLQFSEKMNSKDILGSLVYFSAGTLFVSHLFALNIGDALWVYLPIQLVVFIGLLYLAIWDIQTMTIPSNFTNLFLLFVVVINFLVGLSSFIELRNTGINTLTNLNIGTLGNMLAGVGLGVIIFLLHKFTKGKGIGDGDIYIYTAVGFALGLPLGLGFLILSSILGGIVAVSLILLYWKDRQKILRTRIPLLPVILIGYVLTLVLQNFIYLTWGL
jgi:prepilin signal peptidase PulO-like enzyme (type II secretory pathway)